jgi:hypothetical protein
VLDAIHLLGLPLRGLRQAGRGRANVRADSKDSEDGWKFDVLAKMEQHQSINYGGDCQPGVDDEGRRMVFSTSSYDRLLCLWRFREVVGCVVKEGSSGMFVAERLWG